MIEKQRPDVLILSTAFYDLSVLRNIFSKAEMRQFRVVETEGLNHDFQSQKAYLVNGFNQMNSDKVRTGRDVPEMRNKRCLALDYPENLPTTSIIIPFHNELRSTLLRTIISIFQTVPEHLLQEIIIVDDFSKDETIGEELAKIEKVVLIRNRKHEGLIRSRIRGSVISSGFRLNETELSFNPIDPFVAFPKPKNSAMKELMWQQNGHLTD